VGVALWGAGKAVCQARGFINEGNGFKETGSKKKKKKRLPIVAKNGEVVGYGEKRKLEKLAPRELQKGEDDQWVKKPGNYSGW